jgi:hypothetical protein
VIPEGATLSARDALAAAYRAVMAGDREEHRRRLAEAIALAERTDAKAILAQAHAARAEDALHGAGQLSLSAQRAPTVHDCADGWTRVAELVRVVEEAALASGTARAERAAGAARRLLEERNDAYTFHTDHGFSFGEGWHVAAAALLAGAAIQVEPNKPGTAQAERFLREAGLGARLQPFRSRPRAMKQTTELVARAFRADAPAAQRRLRQAFLGDAPIAARVRAWVDRRLEGVPRGPKVLLWIREAAHHPGRNTPRGELASLTEEARAAGLVPIWIGDHGDVPRGVVDLTRFWADPIFTGERRAQLALFEHLRSAQDVRGQLGVTTAGMDGPALLGLPTIYLTGAPNPRMASWAAAVPGYREVVREGAWQRAASEVMQAWAASRPAADRSREPAADLAP